MSATTENLWSDSDRVLVLQYILDKGQLPPWSDGDMPRLAANLFGWPLDRAVKAFDECLQRGTISHDAGRKN